MKLVMDLVVNHTSAEHAWFKESRSSRESPKRDWYWWRERPNNWRSFFSGSAWEPDEATGEHYLHLFARSMPDLNWENPEVREAVYSMMRWWLDRGVDGFRMDVINMISKDPALPDAREPGAGMMPDGSEHFINGPRIHEFMQEMHRSVFAGPARADAHGRRDARRHGRGGAAVHRPGARRGRHGLPVRARQPRPGRDEVRRHGPAPDRPQGVVRALAGGPRGDGLELAVLEQPRPAARRVALRRRRPRAPRALREDARHGPAPAPRDAVRLPGRGARDDERALRPHRRLPRHRVAQPPRRGGRARRRRGHGARRPAHDGPRQRAHADAVGRERARRLHQRRAVDPRQPELPGDQRGGGASPTPTPSSTTTGG